jgi:hypothetical protein
MHTYEDYARLLRLTPLILVRRPSRPPVPHQTPCSLHPSQSHVANRSIARHPRQHGCFPVQVYHDAARKHPSARPVMHSQIPVIGSPPGQHSGPTNRSTQRMQGAPFSPPSLKPSPAPPWPRRARRGGTAGASRTRSCAAPAPQNPAGRAWSSTSTGPRALASRAGRTPSWSSCGRSWGTSRSGWAGTSGGASPTRARRGSTRGGSSGTASPAFPPSCAALPRPVPPQLSPGSASPPALTLQSDPHHRGTLCSLRVDC